jgi:hypothetical protein
MLKGTGVSRLPTRLTGASKYLKQCSEICAAISAPMPPVRVSSCKIMAFPVFFTLASTASLSHGKRQRKSIISASIF